jgi:hypothetical protein
MNGKITDNGHDPRRLRHPILWIINLKFHPLLTPYRDISAHSRPPLTVKSPPHGNQLQKQVCGIASQQNDREVSGMCRFDRLEYPVGDAESSGT